MSLPVADIGEVLQQEKSEPEQKKLQVTLAKIERLILNNQQNN